MAGRARAAWVLTVASVVVAIALAAPADGQLIDDPRPPVGGPSSTTSAPRPTTSTTAAPTTTTTRPEASTTTTTQPGLLGGSSSSTTTSTTTTTPPPAADEGFDPGSSTPAPEGADPEAEGGDGAEPDGQEVTWGYVPPEAQAIIDAVPRSPANSSQALHDAVQELVALGLSPEEAIRIGFGRFPIAGVANFSHDWLYPRYGPGFRFHLGTDVFAPFGTPVRAPVDGTVTSGVGSLGGLYVKVFMEDGTYFYMAHLSALPEGFVDGMAIRTGDIVGFVGDSGNAKGGAPHVHLGIYPRGGPAVDPKPILDQMLADAMSVLPAVIDQVRANQPVSPGSSVGVPQQRTPRSLLATAILRPVLAERAAGGAATAVLFEAVGNPSSGGLAVAEAQAPHLAASIDWNVRAARTRTQRIIVAEANQILRLAAGPLAP